MPKYLDINGLRTLWIQIINRIGQESNARIEALEGKADLVEGKIPDSQLPENATTTTNGLMSSADKTKLDGIDTGANKTVVDTALNSTSTNPVQNKVINSVISAKQNTITGAATTVTNSDLTASRALISNSSGKIDVSAVTSTELGYLDGVTSNIQTQLDGKAASSHTQAASTITAGTFAGAVVAPRNSQTYSTYMLRNSRLASSDTNPSYNGEICWTYE